MTLRAETTERIQQTTYLVALAYGDILVNDNRLTAAFLDSRQCQLSLSRYYPNSNPTHPPIVYGPSLIDET